MKVGFDLGFGWTKVCTDEGQCFKFPSWLAYHTNKSISEVEKVLVDGRDYVVGEDVRYESKKITIASVDELLNYFPVFKKYALSKLGVEDEREVEIITGLPPIYKDKAVILEKQGVEVLPQGAGIYVDVKSQIPAEELLIIDIGFNTVDYLVIVNGIKKKGETLVKQGVEELIEIFRDKLPDEFRYLKERLPNAQLMKEFERGYTIIAGAKEDLSEYKEKAIQEYNEILRTRLKNEIGDFIDMAELVVVAGGGAYYIKDIREGGVFIPEQPEFSQARGYAKV